MYTFPCMSDDEISTRFIWLLTPVASKIEERMKDISFLTLTSSEFDEFCMCDLSDKECAEINNRKTLISAINNILEGCHSDIQISSYIRGMIVIVNLRKMVD